MNKNYKGGKANNSKPSTQDSKFIDILKRAKDYGVSVVYVFRQQRIRFTKEFPKGEYYTVESKQIQPLSPHIFKDVKGQSRSPMQIRDILDGIKNDLGATTFYIE